MNKKMYELLLKNDVVIEEDLFNYGFYVLTTYMKYLMVLIPVSLTIKTFLETLIFIILFIPLRRYIGGLHMKNKESCFFASVIFGILIPYLSTYTYNFPIISTFVIFLICILMTKKYGVIDHPNKKISIKEKNIYLNKSLQIEFIYFLFCISSFFFSIFFINNIISYIFLFFIFGMLIKKLAH